MEIEIGNNQSFSPRNLEIQKIISKDNKILFNYKEFNIIYKEKEKEIIRLFIIGPIETVPKTKESDAPLLMKRGRVWL